MNGAARAFVMKVIENPKATQHEKLNAIITLMLSDHDRLVKIETAYLTHPFSLIPDKHRGKVWATFALWMGAVTWAFFDRIWELGIRLGVWG